MTNKVPTTVSRATQGPDRWQAKQGLRMQQLLLAAVPLAVPACSRPLTRSTFS